MTRNQRHRPLVERIADRTKLTGLFDDNLAELVLFEITQVRSLVLDQHVLFLHQLERLVHLFRLDGGFTGVRVKVDVESLISLFETPDGKVSESGPETERGFVACRTAVTGRCNVSTTRPFAESWSQVRPD